MTTREQTEIGEYLRDLLPRAGQILRRYFRAENLEKRKKGIHDFVTAADLAVDKFLTEELSSAYPHIPLLTEETADYSKLSEYKNKQLLWVIDPLDGTANFSRGDSNHSISVALVSNGIPIVGVIFQPTYGRLFWAIQNDTRAFWNGRTIHVSTIEQISKATVCTDWSHILETRNETTTFLQNIYGHVRQIKILGSAATDITLLARGGVDIYYHVKLFPWDVAAAALIAKNAGATITDTKGEPWNIFSDGILATNPFLHSAISKIISI